MADEQDATSALDPRLRETTTYLNREYQKRSVDLQINLVPIDELEVERLDTQHYLLNQIFRDRPYPPFIAPVEDAQVRDVLDCGHGSGSWAMEVANWLPDCNVIGVDISMQMNPDDIPENLEFQVENLNESFTFLTDSFDLVNSRFVASGISFARWPSYIADIRRKVLRRGGWAQMIEWNLNFRSENGRVDDIQALQRWSGLYSDSLTMTSLPHGKKDRNAYQRIEDLMRAAGFEMVSSEVREIPASPWPADPIQREIGEMSRANLEMALMSLALYPVTKRTTLHEREFTALVTAAVAELHNLQSRPYLTLHIFCGRKA